MKNIKVFLASSEELNEERERFGNFFNHLNRIFKNRGIWLEISMWEYLDKSMGKLRKQEEYNREIKTCDMCMVLYWTRIGDYTREELDVAYNELLAGRKPYKLYIYFKEVGDVGQDVLDFKNNFEPMYGHYYDRFENIDTLKLGFLLQLEDYVNSGAVRLEGSQVFADTLLVASLDNVPFAAKNKHYKELKERLAKIETEINAFEAMLATQENPVFADMLNDRKSERTKLQEELEEHEQSLFNTAKRVAKFAGVRVSERMRRAIALFEDGKATEANTLLDDAERDADASIARYRQTKELLATERDAVIRSIEELTLKASVMLADKSIPAEQRVERTAEIYKKAVALARECEYGKEQLAELLAKQSGFLLKYARYREAENISKEWIALCKVAYGERHEKTADACRILACVYEELRQYDEALKYNNKALEIYQETLGPSHASVAIIYNNLGAVYDGLGRYEDALEYYNKAFATGMEPKVLGTLYNNFGHAYTCIGNYDKALEFHNKSLEMRLEHFGDYTPEVMISYGNIGMTLSMLGKHEEALEYCTKALNIGLKCFGTIHPMVATTYSSLAVIYSHLNNEDMAIEYHKKALEISLKCFGASHVNVASSHRDLGVLYYDNGKNNEAIEHYQKAVEIYSKCSGDFKMKIAELNKYIGNAYHNLKKYDIAKDFYIKAKDLYVELYGQNSPDVANLYSYAGTACYNACRYALALEYYKNELNINVECLERSNPAIAISHRTVALAFNKMGEFEQAIMHYKQALALFMEQPQPDSADINALYVAIVNSYFKLGNERDAIKYAKCGADAGCEACIEWLRDNGVK